MGLDLVWYSSKVCLEICNYLDVSLFKIPYETEGTVTDSANNLNGGSSHSGRRTQLSVRLMDVDSFVSVGSGPVTRGRKKNSKSNQ